MTKESIFHILKARDGWRVVLEGAESAFSSFGTLQEAAEAARKLAIASKPSRVILHASDGSVQAEKAFKA
ncbi:MAG: DUF2188 domain-containing protein [Anaerolineales bacterium]